MSNYEPYGPEAAAAASEPQADWRKHLRLAWGYKWLIVITTLLVVGGTFLVLDHMTPRYSATATLLLTPPETKVTDLKNVVEGLDANIETVLGEVEVLKSRELAVETLQRLRLSLDPQKLDPKPHAKSFLSHLNPLNYFSDLDELWRALKVSILVDHPERHEGDASVDAFLENLTVVALSGTRVIKIQFTSYDPKTAAQIANELAEVYVQRTVEIKTFGTRRAASWLATELESQKTRVDQSEAAALAVREGAVLVEDRNRERVSQQLSALNQELVQISTDKVRLTSQLAQIRKLQASNKIESTNGTTINSTVIDGLRLQLLQLQRKYAQLSTEYGEKHPTILMLRSEIEDTNKKIKQEIGYHIDSIENELSVANAREKTINGMIEEVTQKIDDFGEPERRLVSLEREAGANRNLYESLLNRYKEVSVQEKIQQPDARIINYAQVPYYASSPNRLLALGIAFIFSILLSGGLVFGLESLQNSFVTARQLEEQTGLRVLTQIPQVRLGRKATHPADYVKKGKVCRYSESISNLYSSLRWSSSSERETPKLILLTSTLPREGKTSLAISFARRASLLGDRVFLIDCDLRHPEASKFFGGASLPGIVDVLSGKSTLAEAIRKDSATGFTFLPAGSPAGDPVAVFQSKRFQQFLVGVRECFDLVVVDSSPVLGVTEAQILGRLVDEAVLLVRWGETPRDCVIVALNQLEHSGVRVAGLVLSRVKLNQQAKYGYGEYGYYSKRMQDYYHSSKSRAASQD